MADGERAAWAALMRLNSLVRPASAAGFEMDGSERLDLMGLKGMG